MKHFFWKYLWKELKKLATYQHINSMVFLLIPLCTFNFIPNTFVINDLNQCLQSDQLYIFYYLSLWRQCIILLYIVTWYIVYIYVWGSAPVAYIYIILKQKSAIRNISEQRRYNARTEPLSKSHKILPFVDMWTTNSELRNLNNIMALRNGNKYCVPFVHLLWVASKNSPCPIFLELEMNSNQVILNHLQAKWLLKILKGTLPI